jgi:hypothetical protein
MLNTECRMPNDERGTRVILSAAKDLASVPPHHATKTPDPSLRFRMTAALLFSIAHCAFRTRRSSLGTFTSDTSARISLVSASPT